MMYDDVMMRLMKHWFVSPEFNMKILVLTDFDQMKTPLSYTSLESYGSWRFNHIARNTDHLTCQPSEFRGRSWTDFLDDLRLCHICQCG